MEEGESGRWRKVCKVVRLEWIGFGGTGRKLAARGIESVQDTNGEEKRLVENKIRMNRGKDGRWRQFIIDMATDQCELRIGQDRKWRMDEWKSG